MNEIKMDIQQMKNMLMIEKEGSISKAAEKLFVTQSGLNQQLLHLEKDLGTPLFDRVKHTMVPTMAGRVYLDNARQTIQLWETTCKEIQDIAEEKTGEISIAFTPERGSRMFQHIFPIFHAIYPHIYFKIHEARNIRMEELLEKREVDMICTTYDAGRRNPGFTYIAGVKEEYLLGIPETNPVLRDFSYSSSTNTDRSKLDTESLLDTDSPAKEKAAMLSTNGELSSKGQNIRQSSSDSPTEPTTAYPVFDITLLKDQEFILGNAETRSHAYELSIFAYASMTPKVLFETSSSGTKLAMMQKQIAPAFLPQAYVNKDDPIRYFRCPPYPSWTTCVATRRDDYLTVPELVLADLIRRYNQNEVGMKTKKLLMR